MLQNHQYFTCGPGKGVFVPVTHVIPDPRFTESLPPPSSGQDFGPLDSPIVPGHQAPHPPVDSISSICGRNKGIQGEIIARLNNNKFWAHFKVELKLVKSCLGEFWT